MQVGAIVLYTYVFQMLAPPPGGSYDVTEVPKLPMRVMPVDGPLEHQVPLLASGEPVLVDADLTKRGKVTLC